MKPVAAAMDLLQGEGDCYIGHVIPTIKGIAESEEKRNRRWKVDLMIN